MSTIHPVLPPPSWSLAPWPLPRGRAEPCQPVALGTGEPTGAVEAAFDAARAGSADGWTDLYREARPQLFRFARLRLATDEQAEDAVAETFARAMAAAGRYRAGPGPLPWLVGICRNVVREAYRAGGRVQSIDPAGFVARADPAPEAGPAERAVADEDADGLRRAYALLSEDDREVLALRVVVGLDADAAAEVLGKRAGAVRMAQSRALARLRRHLEEGA